MKYCSVFLVLACFACAPLVTSGDYVDGFGDATDTFGAGGPILDIDTLNVEFDSANL